MCGVGPGCLIKLLIFAEESVRLCGRSPLFGKKMPGVALRVGIFKNVVRKE